jgi:hypothetical protein
MEAVTAACADTATRGVSQPTLRRRGGAEHIGNLVRFALRGLLPHCSTGIPNASGSPDGRSTSLQDGRGRAPSRAKVLTQPTGEQND